MDDFDVPSRWETFRQWVKATQPKSEWLTVAKLKARSPVEATACNAETITKTYNEWEALLRELGISDSDGRIKADQAHRVIVVDEKGFSQRADNLSKGVISNSLKNKASTMTSTATWEHITCTSWLPLAPLPSKVVLPCGIVVPTKGTNDTMKQIWPEACIEGNSGGSSTSSIFCLFLLKCLIEPMRKVEEKEILLIMDSGGGAYMHLSWQFLSLCETHRIRPYMLRGYLTRALCALDQEPHACMARLWSAFKGKWKNNLNMYQALQAIREITQESLTEQRAAAGWARVGLKAGRSIDRDVVLVERYSEVIQSYKYAEKPQTPLMQVIEKCSPSKSRCKACQVWVLATSKYCQNCSIPNENFEKGTYEVHRDGKRSGWKSASEVEVPEGDTSFSREAVTDLLAELRSRTKKQKTSDSAALPPSKEPESGAAAASGKEPSAEVNESDQEWDLNTCDGCVHYLASLFSKERRERVRPVADFFVREHLQPQVRKSMPLYKIMSAELKKVGGLKNTQARTKWLEAWEENRKCRFVRPSKVRRAK